MSNHWIEQCLCCGGQQLQDVLDLGTQPPANSYRTDAATPITAHPLGLRLCADCWHAQLSYCVDRREIFDQYAYVSGTSRTLVDFFTWFAKALAQSMPHGARILELAANDGSFLREMQKEGLNCIGIDPAANIVARAREQGLPILCGYWPDAACLLDGKFSAIVCMNVLAHVDDPISFLQGCAAQLADDGVVIVQPSQARMFENGEFDTIYHEHISFFNTRSISELARRAGLKLVDTAMVKIHGDSPVYFLKHSGAPHEKGVFDAFTQGTFATAEDLPAYEQRAQLFSKETYVQFRNQAQKVIDNVRHTIDEYRARGYDIVFVGAAAKAMTLLHAAGIVPDRFLDESPHKIGLVAGCGNRIEALNALQGSPRPALFVLSAWNFRHELTGKLRTMGVPSGSTFYAYFPTPHFIE